MAMAPIGEAQAVGILSMPQISNRNGSAKETGTDFMQAFSNAQDSMMNDLQAAAANQTDGTGAQGKDSNNTADQNQIQNHVKKSETVKPQQAKENGKTEETKAAEKVTDTEEDFTEEEIEVSEAAVQLFMDIAQMLEISPEELEGALEELGVDASALLEAGTINQLVAQVEAEGDLSALVTDSDLSDLVKDLNAMVGEMVGQLQEEALKNALADALAEVTEEVPEAEVVTVDTQAQQAGTENTDDNAQDEIAEKRRERTEHFEDRAMDAAAQLNTDAPAADVAQVAEDLQTQTEQLRYTINPQEILDQVLDQIKTQVKEDMTSLDMVLHPASLGHVALNLTSRDGAVTAQLTAQNESVRAALESQIQILKENLEQAGVKIEAVEVTVSAHAFEQNLEQGNDQESDAQMQERERLRRATHKINLGDANGDGVEGVDELGEAEAVNVALMQADGRRLDYRT